MKTIEITKEIPRKYDPVGKAVYFELPEGRFRMPVGEITPYREIDPLKLVMGERSFIACFYEMKTGGVALSRSRAIVNQYELYSEGQIVSATVSGTIKEGVFLDFGQGLRGYCPAEETSKVRFMELSRIYHIGRKYAVKILKIDDSYPYHISLSIKQAARFVNVKVGELIRVKIGKALQDGTGAFCEISPIQVGIIDRAPGFDPRKVKEGTEAYGLIKKIKPYLDNNGRKQYKYQIEFLDYVYKFL